MGCVALLVSRTQTARTFVVVVVVVVITAAADPSRQHADDSELQFLQDLGITAKPDLFKANISQEEYISKMRVYLHKRTSLEGNQPNEVPQLVSYNSEHKTWKRRYIDEAALHYRIHIQTHAEQAMQNAELRILLPATTQTQPLTLRLFSTSRLRGRTLLSTRIVALSSSHPKWTDFDVSLAVSNLSERPTRVDFTLECDNCRIELLRPLQTHANILMANKTASRRKRSSYFDMGRPTDCVNVNVLNDRKPNCCRHDMHVSFEKLNMGYIIQPKHYEAGFCRGRCPYHFNHATNHSRIQSLVHRHDKRAIPRSCCAPSKLNPLEILMVDPHDPSKLIVEQWNDMIVSECLCA